MLVLTKSSDRDQRRRKSSLSYLAMVLASAVAFLLSLGVAEACPQQTSAETERVVVTRTIFAAQVVPGNLTQQKSCVWGCCHDGKSRPGCGANGGDCCCTSAAMGASMEGRLDGVVAAPPMPARDTLLAAAASPLLFRPPRA